MKRALVTGVTGQDGAYLVELLLSKSYEVHGIKRRSSLINTERIDGLYQDPHEQNVRFVLHYGGLSDSTNLIRIVQQVQPDKIYNLGAMSHVKVSFDTPEHAADMDSIGTLRLLEANNIYRTEFLYDNLIMEANVIHHPYLNGVKKLLFLGSSCICPKLAPQPLTEDALLTGTLESTNEPYAVAKIAGIKLCDAYRAQYGCNFISAMPTNLYGPHDNYDLKNSHVLPALLRKFHEAKQAGAEEVEVWDTGTPRREFLHVDDLADACYWLLENYNEPGLVDVGTGTDLSIRELAKLVQHTVGYEGSIRFNPSYPDGTPRKLMDVSKLAGFGWTARIGLEEGVRAVYEVAFEAA